MTVNNVLNAPIPFDVSVGGTGATTESAAFDVLSPLTTDGDILLFSDGTNSRFPIGTFGDVLTADGSTLSWTTPTVGTVTSVDVSSSDLTVGGNPITTAGTITLDLNTVGISKGGTGQITQAPAFDALSPTTTSGDLIYRGNTANIRLANGTIGQVLKVLDATAGAVVLGWGTPLAGTVTSVTLTSPNTNSILSGTNPITTSGTINIDVGAPVYWNAAKTSFTIGPKNLPQTGDCTDLYIINTIGLPTATVGGPFGLVAMGRNALGAITTGNENVAFGCGTLEAVTTGSSNTAIGHGAMYNAITSHDNTACGHNSLQGAAATSFNSTALGSSAGSAGGMTSFNNNTFLGANTAIAGASVTPSYRTAVGSAALVGNDNMIQLGAAESVAFGLYGAAAPAALDAAGSGYIALSVINPSGSIYKLATTGVTGVVGLSGIIPIATSGGANATVGTAAGITTSTTVNTTQAHTGSVILLTMSNLTGLTTTLPQVYIGTIVDGTSFQIALTLGTLTSLDVNWVIINP